MREGKVDKIHGSRKASIELLRIAAMLMIVAGHASIHLNFALAQPAYWSIQPYRGIASVIEFVILQYGQVGVQIFFIITGYFLCKKAFSLPRVVKAWAQVFLYSVVLALVSVIILALAGNLSLITSWFSQNIPQNLLKTFAPLVGHEYWFMTAYVLLLLLAPALNAFIRKFGRRGLERALILFAFIAIVPLLSADLNYYGEPFRAIFGYLIGAYIQNYLNLRARKYRPRNLFLVVFASIAVSLAFTFVALRGGSFAHSFAWDTMPTVGVPLVASIIAAALFILCVRPGRADRLFAKNPRTHAAILLFSSATFGVYLISENLFVGHLLWGAANKFTAFAVHGPTLEKFSLLILVTLCVFVICAVAAIVLDRLLAPLKKYLVTKVTPRLAKLKIFAD